MRQHHSRRLLAGLLVGFIAAGSAQAASSDSELVALVQRHAQAQSGIDQATLKAITAENYVEISPAGELDQREKMLSFYAPERKRAGPELRVDQPEVRLFGDVALVSVRLSYTISQDGTARTFAMRGGYAARRVDQQWLLISAQYTAIRAQKQ